MINEDSIQVAGKTEDSISEPGQVGQESGVAPWLCMCRWRGQKKRDIAGKKKKRRKPVLSST